MPLVEFMKHPVQGATKSKNPNFIRGSADYYNPDDGTYVGWVPNNRDFYLPETIVVLDKQGFVDRALSIHASHPMQVQEDPFEDEEDMTVEQVTVYAGNEYDRIVAHCENED